MSTEASTTPYSGTSVGFSATYSSIVLEVDVSRLKTLEFTVRTTRLDSDTLKHFVARFQNCEYGDSGHLITVAMLDAPESVNTEFHNTLSTLTTIPSTSIADICNRCAGVLLDCSPSAGMISLLGKHAIWSGAAQEVRRREHFSCVH